MMMASWSRRAVSVKVWVSPFLALLQPVPVPIVANQQRLPSISQSAHVRWMMYDQEEVEA